MLGKWLTTMALGAGSACVISSKVLDFTSTSCVGDLLLFRSKQTTACKTNEPTLKNNEQILKPWITWETLEIRTKNNKITINTKNRRRPGGFRAAGPRPLNYAWLNLENAGFTPHLCKSHIHMCNIASSSIRLYLHAGISQFPTEFQNLWHEYYSHWLEAYWLKALARKP